MISSDTPNSIPANDLILVTNAADGSLVEMRWQGTTKVPVAVLDDGPASGVTMTERAEMTLWTDSSTKTMEVMREATMKC